MSNAVSNAKCIRRTLMATAALASGLALGLASASAQTPAPAAAPAKEAPKAAAPAAPAAKPAAAAPAASKEAAAKDAPKSSWVKLCDKVANVAKDKDGKDVKTEKSVCATFHDTVDANSGLTVVSAAIREVEGNAKPDLQVTVPLGMILPAGARVSVLSAEQAELLKKDQKLEAKDLKQHELKFSACLPNGCTAEIEAPDGVIDDMKAGAVLLVRSIYVNGQPFTAPVALNGFSEALAGKAVDNEAYKKARGEMMAQIRARQNEMMEKYKAKMEEEKKNLPAAPAATGSTPAAKPAAPAPAEKK